MRYGRLSKRCLGASTDTILVRRGEGYVAANPAISNAPMSTVVLRALFDLCRADIRMQSHPLPAPATGELGVHARLI
jgi:hypothetical protein